MEVRVKTVLMTILACAGIALAGVACGSSKSTPTPAPAHSATAVPASPPAATPAPAHSATAAAASPAATQPATAAPCPTATSATPPASIHSVGTPSASMPALMTGARTETSACEDRVVFEFAPGALPGWDARYLPGVVGCGSGAPITTQGSAQLAISFTPVDAHDSAGNATVANRDLLPGYPSLKEAVISCDFEAEVAWALGTAQRPFTVTAQPNAAPPTIIVTIAH
jgi:hypothetical protein